MRRGRAIGAFSALLLLCPSVFALPPSVPPSDGAPPGLFASPHEAAFEALDRQRTADHLLPEPDLLTANQMMGVLAWLNRATLFPSRTDMYEAEALALWDAAEPAWDELGQFYYVTRSQSNCIRVDVNGWALLATQHLTDSTGEFRVAERRGHLVSMLEETVRDGEFRGTPRCATPMAWWPIPILALLDHAVHEGSTSSRAVALTRLGLESAAHFGASGAFVDPAPADFIFLATNAQYLVALQEAARLDPSGPWAVRRDALVSTLQNVSLGSEAGMAVGWDVSIQPEIDPVPALPGSQAWFAYALHHQRRISPATVRDASAPEKLLDALLRRDWSDAAGGFAGEGGAQTVESNAIVAMMSSGASIIEDRRQVENPRLQWVVPSDRDHTYAPNTTYIRSNVWTFRFQLDTLSPYPSRIVLPVSRLGPIQFKLPEPFTAPTPQLLVSGALHPSDAIGRDHPLIGFAIPSNATGVPLRLEAFAPLAPSRSFLAKDVRLELVSNSTVPIRVDLVLDLALDQVNVTSIRVNDLLLPPAKYSLQSVPPADFLSEPHVRLELRDFDVAPGTNEILIEYEDSQRPSILPTIELSADDAGEQPIKAEKIEDKDVFQLPRGGAAYVRVQVDDNAALKTVRMVVYDGDDDTGRTVVTLAPDTTQPRGWYKGQLPRLQSSGPVRIQVEAVDEHDNLAQSAPYLVQTKPWLAVFEIVLLVFSATLFASAIVIWVRMGRRRRVQ